MKIFGLSKINKKRYAVTKSLPVICLLLFFELCLPGCGDCLCQETADIIASWTNCRSSDGFEFNFGTGINCGTNEDCRDSDSSTTTYNISKSGNSIIHFGVTDQVRYPGTRSVMLHTDANIYAVCGPNFTVERAEINLGWYWRQPGRAREGNTVWMGWSEMWTDIDE